MSPSVRPPVDSGTVLVTGASAGIGRELASQVAPRAGALVLLARRADRLEELCAELVARHPQLRVVVLPADLSDEADVTRVLQRVHDQVGEIDVLVNNAGIGDSVLFDRSSWSRTRQLLATNVLAPAQLTAALVPHMVARGRGGVLNIGSGVGLTVLPGAAAYTGSKHFVDGFSEALRGPCRHRCGRHPGLSRSDGERVRPGRQLRRRHDRRAAAGPGDQREAMRAGGARRF